MMRSLIIAIVALCCTANAVYAAVTIDMVTVGDAGNAADATGYGAVAYEYQIGKYEVTIGQYTDFLNAVDPDGTNPHGIYNNMFSYATDLKVAGISFTAEANTGSKYAVIAAAGIAPYGGVSNANRPVAYVSWYSAARFCNWMQNGQGTGSTETGAYTLGNAIWPEAIPANSDATYRLPTEDEWYKAAYYSPDFGGVGVPGYYTYATQSDTAPGNEISSGVNQANYAPGGVWSVTQLATYSSNQNYLTAVGSFTNSASYYGTFDQSGNISEWNDLTGSEWNRGLRGGEFGGLAFHVSSLARSTQPPALGDYNTGFRLAAPVPEPSVLISAAAGFAIGVWHLSRRQRASRAPTEEF